MLMTLVVFAGYGVFAAAVRTHLLERPRILDRLRRRGCRQLVLMVPPSMSAPTMLAAALDTRSVMRAATSSGSVPQQARALGRSPCEDLCRQRGMSSLNQPGQAASRATCVARRRRRRRDGRRAMNTYAWPGRSSASGSTSTTELSFSGGNWTSSRSSTRRSGLAVGRNACPFEGDRWPVDLDPVAPARYAPASRNTTVLRQAARIYSAHWRRQDREFRKLAGPNRVVRAHECGRPIHPDRRSPLPRQPRRCSATT